jgi:hypothetical protein
MKKICLLLSLIVIFISVQAQVPVNDEPCGAIDVPVLPGEPLSGDCLPTTFYSYTNATLTPAIPNPTCVGGTLFSNIRDVWYKFIVPTSGSFIINTNLNPSTNDLIMSIYTANLCSGTFTQIGCNDDYNGAYPRISANASPGQTVYIRMFNFPTSIPIISGEFRMCIIENPTNNNPVIDNTTKVGIGINTPFAKLDVAGSGIFRDTVIFAKTIDLRSGLKIRTGAAYGNILTSDIYGNASWQTPTLPTNYWSLNGSNIYNNNTSNVGINFANATEKLQVDGNIKLGSSAWSNLATDRTIKFGDGDFVKVGERFVDDELHLYGAQGIIFRSNGDVERMRINNFGNVGIGTNNPTFLLHLNNANSGLRIEGPAAAASGGSALNIGGFGNIVIDKPGVVAGRLLINEDGDVGIGSATPSAYGHGGTNRILEVRNFAPVGTNIQSHLILSSTANAGSMGGITWASTSVTGEQRTGYIGAAFETANQTRLSFYTRSNAGSLAERFYIQGTGNAWLQGTLTQNSDIRLKKNIVPLQSSLNKLTQLNGYTYNWISKDKDPREQIGLVAQEVQKLYPQLVSEIKGQNGETNLAVNYIGLIPVMIESIKEQQKQMDELKILVQKLLNK